MKINISTNAGNILRQNIDKPFQEITPMDIMAIVQRLYKGQPVPNIIGWYASYKYKGMNSTQLHHQSLLTAYAHNEIDNKPFTKPNIHTSINLKQAHRNPMEYIRPFYKHGLLTKNKQ